MSESIAPGVTIRACASDDRDAVLALVATCETEEMGSPDPAMLDGVSVTWQRADFDCATDAWLAVEATTERVVGYAHLNPAERPELNAFASVHPETRGRGIGTALLARIEQHANAQRGRFAVDAALSVQQWVAAGNQPAHELLERSGYAVVRHIWGMIIALAAEPAPVRWPTGIIVRAAETEADLRAAHAAYRDAFQDHWGFGPQSYEDFAHAMIEIDTFDASLWFLAMDGDEVAGVLLGETLPDRGWVNDLAVRRGWRGRGLGESLLRHAFGDFYRRGERTVALGVDSQNLTGATRLYERAGMRIERQYDIYQKGL